MKMVNASMLAKYSGKYDILYGNLIKKYGPLGSPIEQPTPPSSAGSAGPSAGPRAATSKSDLSDYYDEFTALIQRATPSLGPRALSATTVVAGKASDASNGLETSTFTVCSRVRPLLGDEVSARGSVLEAVVAGERIPPQGDAAYTEEMLLCNPKVGITGKPKIESAKFAFDYVFGKDSTNEEVYACTCKPLLERAKNGQVGVIFAYGQTGSGKTHTMNGLMSHIVNDGGLFEDGTLSISFSYIEMLGKDINDCLNTSATDPVQIGESLDGRILTKNLSKHDVDTPEMLNALITKAQSLRSTAATSRNATSSRSHGIGILLCVDKNTGIEGKLVIIDLAGSERAADSKEHDRERMAETKEINASLMSLKECIRARTLASRPGNGSLHVPYRRNKLTLFLKDVFDIGCSRLCSTVVITACSPLAADISHTANTLKYASPLRVAAQEERANGRKARLELDVMDPALWTAPQVIDYLKETHTGLPDPEAFLGGLSGVHLCSLPEKEFYLRAAGAGASEDVGKEIYLAVWALISDAKTRKRRPNGTLITEADEEKERQDILKAKEEKAALWAEREKHLRKEF
jgi:kinesin family protein 2/24